jgi:hypothetical protein
MAGVAGLDIGQLIYWQLNERKANSDGRSAGATYRGWDGNRNLPARQIPESRSITGSLE